MIDEVALHRIQKKREEAIIHSQEAPMKFLSAWVSGVRVIGEGYFTHNERFGDKAPCLDKVTDKWQVIPNRVFVEENIGVLSGGEARLLAVMCSFYNPEWGGKLMQDLGIQGMADISGNLDLKCNKIVASLSVNYTGW